MAKPVKEIEVQKFGGVDKLGEVELHGFNHDVSSIEEQSQTSLEQDMGVGQIAVIRCFEFKANVDAFKEHPPTKQDLFNYHSKGIEIALWRDGLKVLPEVEPRLVLDEQKGMYRIFIGAVPAKGESVLQKPITLSELVHGQN